MSLVLLCYVSSIATGTNKYRNICHQGGSWRKEISIRVGNLYGKVFATDYIKQKEETVTSKLKFFVCICSCGLQ